MKNIGNQVATRLDSSFIRDPIFYWLLITPIIFWFVIYIENLSTSKLDTKTAILVIVVLPVIEEVIFRGILQPWLAIKYSQKIMNITQANLITSCIFALLHLFEHKLTMALGTFLPSLVFGYARDRYKGIVPSIILHSSYNGGYFLIGTQLINN